VENPFAVTGTIEVVITSPAGQVRKPVQLVAGTVEYRIPLTEAEIRLFLGQPGVQISVSGTVTAPSGTVTVTPAQAVVLRSRLELTLGARENQP
jgi:hypothetical protein